MATFYSAPATGMTVELSDNGGTNYARAQNVTSVDITPVAKTETTTETLDNDPVVSVGSAQPSDVSIGINRSAGKGYRIASKAYRDGTRPLVRFQTKRRQVINNSTSNRTLAVVAATAGNIYGALTGVNTMFNSDPWQPGMAIKLGTQTLIIEEITSDTAAMVSRADGAAITPVTATDTWELWEYGLQWVFTAEVLNAGGASFATGGTPVTDTLTLKSVGVVPDPTLLVTTV